jgi:hypothetical protein
MRLSNYITLIAATLFAFATKAQTDTVHKTTGYIAIGIGADIPTGAYASTNSQGFGGYAAPGLSRFITGAVIINKVKFGFAITEGAFTSWFKTNTYLSKIKAPDTVSNATFGRLGGQDYYGGGFGLLGVLADIKCHKFDLDFKVMAGRFTVLFPELVYYMKGYNPSGKPIYVAYDYLSTQTYSLGFEFGTDIRYSFTKHFCAMVTAEYLYSQFFYSTIEQNSNMPAGNESIISIIDITGGVAYQF